MTIIQPVQLPTTDGRELNILVTQASKARIIRELGVDITELKAEELQNMKPGMFNALLALCAVRWDNERRPRPGWTFDPELQPEIDELKAGNTEPMEYIFEIQAASMAWVELQRRTNKGLPTMPAPSSKTSDEPVSDSNPSSNSDGATIQ